MSDTPETDHLFDLDNMQYQRDLAMKVLKRLERERDEAREALREMWQSGDAFLPHVDSETVNRWRKAAGWDGTK
jgi:quinol monooxygenase YgiN